MLPRPWQFCAVHRDDATSTACLYSWSTHVPIKKARSKHAFAHTAYRSRDWLYILSMQVIGNDNALREVRLQLHPAHIFDNCRKTLSRRQRVGKIRSYHFRFNDRGLWWESS
ncbi:hypothetical protein PMIN01_03923 [Paraphaeosphaeria minitans]|uniref:Uncharacterized protein n=1 Tax=Paraphaeosphaeria minitans TaxID=565426 RepID=A0A9P6KTU6_9PLEO|nr:hypothetical protein PMIN01_03923 [Paraphaeosphaeria minitans]